MREHGLRAVEWQLELARKEAREKGCRVGQEEGLQMPREFGRKETMRALEAWLMRGCLE
ncbi:MAG: hypothetical protein NZM43_09250 [Saprospiraceae bacterium]|nr:hypothetical protein [Saprospiraceae bacterium]MDW8484500.1 hypothetical protein [Saprospiraceae bacterium]